MDAWFNTKNTMVHATNEEKLEEKGLPKDHMRRAFIDDNNIKEHYKIEDEVLGRRKMTDEMGNVQ